MAVEKENIEIIKLLISNNKIDPNIINILIYKMNEIQNQIIQCNSKSNHSITFKIKSFNVIQNQITQ